MIDVVLIRHGRTSWNDEGRIQGRRDIALNARGRAELAARHIPPELARHRWFASPLARAVESARILGARDLTVDARLAELDWGRWEGCTRAHLRTHHARAFAENEARGLDFRPPEGESPRELRARLQAWLADVAADGRNAIAVTHKGVIQMALALATGWDLVSRAPLALEWSAAQHFALDGEPARLELVRANVVLTSARATADGDSREIEP